MEKTSEGLIGDAKSFFESYKQELGRFAKEGKKTITVSFQDLASFSHELSELLMSRPQEAIRLLELSLEELGLITHPVIEIINLPTSSKIKMKGIKGENVGRLVYLDAILQHKSEVYPAIFHKKFECPNCGSIISVFQEGKSREPKKCSCGRKGNFKQIGRDSQDGIDIGCRDIKEEGQKRIDIRKFSILGNTLADRVDDISEGSKIRIYGVPVVEERNGEGLYSFHVINIEILETAEELEMTLIQNEAQLRDFLFKYSDYIEPNLTRVAMERRFDNITEYYEDDKQGRADIIFIDSHGRHLIIELKIEGHSKAVSQLKNYIRAYARENGITEDNLRGMIGCLHASPNLEKECKKERVELKIFDKIKKTTKKDHLADIPESMKKFKLPSEQSFSPIQKPTQEISQFDIDKISGVTASQKNKILALKEAIVREESKTGRLISVEELYKEVFKHFKDIHEMEGCLEKLAIAGDIFKPKRGFIQRM